MKRILGVVFSLLLIPTLVGAQSGVKKRRPLPPEYGRISVGSSYSEQKFPDAQFDHWLHRAKFTCRVGGLNSRRFAPRRMFQCLSPWRS